MIKGNGHDRKTDNVTSFEDARRRATEKAKSAPKSGAPRGSLTSRQMLFGGLVIVMAIGYLASLVMRATTAISGVPT